MFRKETDILKKSLPKLKLEEFQEIEGILYYTGRLDQKNQITIKDLDFELFLDNKQFIGFLPVVRSNSQLFFSYLMNIHTKIRPHAGVEITVRELYKKMYIPGQFRHIIKRVRLDCSLCKIISKKTIELELAKHHSARTLIAPVFYTVQIDIVFGFKSELFKGSRKRGKIYALVFVCLLISATNILAIENIETQSVIGALERHAARYGMPAEIYVDNGSQLAAIDKYRVSLRDIDMQMYDSRGVRVILSTAKSHEERGRVEAKVKLLRDMLHRYNIDEKNPLTPLEWETVFAKISNTLDDVPMAKGNSSNVSDLGFDILTPNRLKMGRNNFRSIYIDGQIVDPTIPSKLLEKNRKIMSAFFQILMDRLHHLQLKPKKWLNNDIRPPQIDDVVLFKFSESNSEVVWKLGRLIKVDSRKLTITYSN